MLYQDAVRFENLPQHGVSKRSKIKKKTPHHGVSRRSGN